MFAFIASILASIFSALMLIYDRLMITDCYDRKPDHAWFVSSFMGTVLGFVVTIPILLVLYFFYEIPVLSLLVEVFYPHGLWMLLSGVLSVLALRHYFRVFIPENEDDAINETAISMWLASLPIFVLFSLVFINYFHLNIGIFSNLDHAEISWPFIIATIVATIGLIGFEGVGKDGSKPMKWTYYKEIGMALFLFVVYSLIIYAVAKDITTIDPTILSFIFLPFYWLGWAFGTLLWFKRDFRNEFKISWPRIRHFAVPILIAEIIGMLVYFFSFVSLNNLDPTLVNLIFSAHILLVFVLNYLLRLLYADLVSKKETSWTLFGFKMSIDSLPQNGTSHLSSELFFLIVALIGIMIATNMVVFD